MRYLNPDVWMGGVYLVDGDVGSICRELIELLSTQNIPAFMGWEAGLSKSRGSLTDVTYEMVAAGLERDPKYRAGGVSFVELRHQDFGLSSIPRLKGLAMVETDRKPKRMVAWLTESPWVAGVLGNIVEDVRRVEI